MKTPTLNNQIYTEASDWLLEFRSGDIDATGRKAFYQWLRTSPEHMRAYLELAAIWNEGAGLDSNHTFDADRLIRDIQSQANIVPLQPVPASGVEGPAQREGQVFRDPRSGQGEVFSARSARVRLTIAASILIAAIALGTGFYSQRDTYSTGIGEQHTLALSDGSRIQLNAQSKVRIRFSNALRSIELLRGQAFFQVAQDKTRPLVVTSDNIRVRAVGTQFDVYRKPSGTTVTVLEGRVAVFPGFPNTNTTRDSPNTPNGQAPRGSAGEGEVFLSVGEQAIITAQTTVKQTPPDVTAAAAWTQGRLVFQGTPLQDVADEFNRYNTRRLIIHDPQLATFKVTGIFASTDPTSLIRFLQTRPGVTVTETGNEILITRK